MLRQANDTTAELALTYGVFLQNVLDFLIISFSIFMAIRMINKVRRKRKLRPRQRRRLSPAPKKSC